MTTHAETLATRFEEANQDVIRTVEGLTDAQWRATTEEEGWTVGVVAHHIADAHAKVAGLAEMVARGAPVPPLTWDMLHQANAAHARDHAGCTRADTLALLRQNGAAATRTLRGLTDEQLGRTATLLGGTMSAAQVVENIVIGHPRAHLASIRKALGAR
jgi:hypothetical protein